MTPDSIERAVSDKVAASRSYLDQRQGPLHVSVVFAMFKETRRLQSPEVDPLGEDFLNVKVAQLRDLFGGDDGWDLIAVDDGCPDGSGQAVEGVARDRGYGNVSVLCIADAIGQGHPVVAGLSAPDDSRKGGAVELGMYEACQQQREGHVVVYTDADISTHLGQTGNLVRAIDNGAICAAGSRREPDSVVVKSGARSDRGKIFIYLWKQMLPELGPIVDSQCGFKGFAAAHVASLVEDTVEKQFAFDIELLLKAELARQGSVTKVGVAWIDSEAGSTTTDLEPYLPMLKAVAKMNRRYSAHDERARSFVEFVESMTKGEWERLVQSIPEEITNREPLEYTHWAGVAVEEIARAASTLD